MLAKKRIILLFLVCLIIFCTSCSSVSDTSNDNSALSDNFYSSIDVATLNGEMMKVHFLSTGHSDCSVIVTPSGKNILVDSGDTECDGIVTKFFREKGITEFEIAIFTHPHGDHIGTAANIIKNYDIKTVYMPNISYTTRAYEKMISALENKPSIDVVCPTPGDKIQVDGVDFTFLSPWNKTYNELNEYSIVFKMVYGENSFLFTGDAEKVNEKEMINAGFDLSADVLKVGHHGSYSSTTQEFLDAVSPSYAVILCGIDNSYGHPHREVKERLQNMPITVYRTDLDGNISFYFDKVSINIIKEK
jgi:competence protein ComEC